MVFDLSRIEEIEHREQCRAYAYELLSSLRSDDLMLEFAEELEDCFKQLAHVSVDLNRDALHKYYKEIKAARKIDQEPFVALLSSPILNVRPKESMQLYRLTALVLIATTSQEMLTSRISSALRQLRLLAAGLNNNNNTEEHVVSLIPKDIGCESGWLNDLHYLMSLDNKFLKNRFTPIHRLLEDFIEGTPKNVKNRSSLSAKVQEGSRIEAVSRITVDSTSDVEHLRIHDFRQIVQTNNVNLQEHIADQTVFSRIVDLELIAPINVRTSLALQNQRTRQIANQLIKNEKRLKTSWNQLTPHELRVGVKSLLGLLESGSHIAGILLFVMMTGLSPPALIRSIKSKDEGQTRRMRKIDGRYVLSRRMFLPVHDQSDRAAKLVRTCDMTVQLPIPQFLISTILRINKSNHDDEELLESANHLISQINALEGTRLTLSRIKLYFTDWLLAESADTAIIEWLTGIEVTEHSAVYYSQIKKEVLIDLYSKYIEHIFPKDALAGGLSHVNENSKALVGSQLFIKADAVLKLGLHFRETLASRVISENDFEVYHNQFTAYTYLILNLSTGHRPVLDPFGTIKSFSISTKTVHIQDKDVSGQQSGRVIALPDLAIEQYGEYLKYIESINRQFQFTNPKLSEYSKGMLSGEHALFFWLKDSQAVRLKPSNIFNEMKHVFPFAVNWHRHHMRTALSMRNNETESINAWMGHSSFGNETYSSNSGASIGQMRAIADDIQDYLVNTLCLSVIETWL